MSATVVEDLERRLRALEDERLIVTLLHAYGHAVDYGDESGWVGLFVPDGLFEVHDQHSSPVRSTRGSEDLLAWITAHTRWPEHRHKHIVQNPVVTLDGDRAHASSFFLRVDAEQDDRFIYAFGRYLDELRRCDDGVWRFERRIVELEARRDRMAPVLPVPDARHSAS